MRNLIMSGLLVLFISVAIADSEKTILEQQLEPYEGVLVERQKLEFGEDDPDYVLYCMSPDLE